MIGMPELIAIGVIALIILVAIKGTKVLEDMPESLGKGLNKFVNNFKGIKSENNSLQDELKSVKNELSKTLKG